MLEPLSTASPLRLKLRKRSREIRKIAGVEHLDACGVIPIERSYGGRAACLYCILRRIEPQAQVIRVDRCRCRIRGRIREGGTGVRGRGGGDIRRHDERL